MPPIIALAGPRTGAVDLPAFLAVTRQPIRDGPVAPKRRNGPHAPTRAAPLAVSLLRRCFGVSHVRDDHLGGAGKWRCTPRPSRSTSLFYDRCNSPTTSFPCKRFRGADAVAMPHRLTTYSWPALSGPLHRLSERSNHILQTLHILRKWSLSGTRRIATGCSSLPR